MFSFGIFVSDFKIFTSMHDKLLAYICSDHDCTQKEIDAVRSILSLWHFQKIP
jgi:hypothetical protein